VKSVIDVFIETECSSYFEVQGIAVFDNGQHIDRNECVDEIAELTFCNKVDDCIVQKWLNSHAGEIALLHREAYYTV